MNVKAVEVEHNSCLAIKKDDSIKQDSSLTKEQSDALFSMPGWLRKGIYAVTVIGILATSGCGINPTHAKETVWPPSTPTPAASEIVPTLTVKPSKTKTPTATQSPTRTLSPSLSPIPPETVIASPKVLPTEVVSPSPTKTTTIEPSLTATLTSTPEDYGYACDLDDLRKGPDNNKGIDGYMIEGIRSDNSNRYNNSPEQCEVLGPLIEDFKNRTLFSQLRLDGITDEEQKEAIFNQCKELSLSILATPPPEIPGITFGREPIQGKWVDSISFEKTTDKLWLLYNPNVDACEWKVIH
jgi:hypothetical protein